MSQEDGHIAGSVSDLTLRLDVSIALARQAKVNIRILAALGKIGRGERFGGDDLEQLTDLVLETTEAITNVIVGTSDRAE